MAKATGTFYWGASASAYQTEGAWNSDGKGPSIWDEFTSLKGKIRNNDHGRSATNFYHHYEADIQKASQLGIPNLRFSFSWPRIIPEGIGKVNPKGIAYYDRVIDTCLENGIEPWFTLYHWDLPQALENKGGWTNREVIKWFSEYAAVCATRFGDRVRNWMVLNEPMVFTGAGYFLGVHAPGKKGMRRLLPAIHHTTMSQAEGGRVLKEILPTGSKIGTTFSSSYVTPYTDTERDIRATRRVDTLLNRLFLEPALGMGYPVNGLRVLRRIEKYIKGNDESLMTFDFDFIGLQLYTREVIRYSFLTPFIQARIVPAHTRKVYHTSMNWEVYPEALYKMIKRLDKYENIKSIIITENGAAFHDQVKEQGVNDTERVQYIGHHIEQVMKARKEGARVNGYFVWALTDNFEWQEGYAPRFGLIYVDYKTQERIIKDSGYSYHRLIKTFDPDPQKVPSSGI